MQCTEKEAGFMRRVSVVIEVNRDATSETYPEKGDKQIDSSNKVER